MTQFDWTNSFRGTRRLRPELRARLRSVAKTRHYAAGDRVFGPDKIPNGLMFLLSGTVRVAQSSDSGREIVLYRVEAGQSCVLTTACMLAEEAYNAEGHAETPVTAIFLPRQTFDDLVANESEFRDFVFAAYSQRLIDMLRVVDDVAFGRIDVRLADRLLALAGNRDEVSVTHQVLAVELGTAREVISRVLQDFQKRGLIVQGRGRIVLADRAKLLSLSESR